MYGMHDGMDKSTVEQGLRKSMDEEAMAARVYRERAQVASEEGDPTSAQLWLHIADEEDGHYNEFRARLNEIQGQRYLGEVTEALKEKNEEQMRRRHVMEQSSHGMEEFYPGGHPHAMAHREFPENYGDWVNLAEDIKDRDPGVKAEVNKRLAAISSRDSDPPDVTAAQRWLMQKAHELGID